MQPIDNNVFCGQAGVGWCMPGGDYRGLGQAADESFSGYYLAYPVDRGGLFQFGEGACVFFGRRLSSISSQKWWSV